MSVHILILAAGEGRRFGGGVKQLAKIGQKTLLEQAEQRAIALAPGRVSVVLGFRHSQLAPLVQQAQVVINPHWANGIGASIACGVAALPASARAVLLLLCDQVALTPADLTALIQAYQSTRNSPTAPILCAQYQASLGVPAIFPSVYFPQLAALKGDKGAQHLLQQPGVIPVPMASAAIDIDTQEDWAEFTQSPRGASLCKH